MAILTKKEYDKRQTGISAVKEALKEPPKEPSTQREVLSQKIPESLYEYVMFYPDNVATRYHHGTYRMVVENEPRSYPIINGVVVVKTELEKTLLKQKGFLFVERREVEDEL